MGPRRPAPSAALLPQAPRNTRLGLARISSDIAVSFRALAAEGGRLTPLISTAPAPNISGRDSRWRAFTYEEIVARDKGRSRPLLAARRAWKTAPITPEPNILAQEIAADLRSALGQIEDILGDLEQRIARESPTLSDLAVNKEREKLSSR
jgi:hypothetical protein